jgi:hypothetical protein
MGDESPAEVLWQVGLIASEARAMTVAQVAMTASTAQITRTECIRVMRVLDTVLPFGKGVGSMPRTISSHRVRA